MKKIININLSGRVIPIEDTAYEKLQSYIESLRRYFSHEEGRDEIINDIESRIAELMNEKIRKGESAIDDNAVEEIIASMGRVEDFEEVDADSATASSASSEQTSSSSTFDPSSRKKQKGRLYRDSSDKILGGVCSGLANYLNVDPAIVRILFAIIGFGGFGLAIYILLWIVLPAQDLEDYGGRRLYRNPADKVIAGVAGGLAAYFNRSASTIRLIFAAPLLLNIFFGILGGIASGEHWIPNIIFGSLTGTFIFAYIVLWIVLPEANSDYQKMEMRGEKVDVNRIRQNVKEGMKGWSEEVKASAQQLSGKAKEFANTRGKVFASEVGQAARKTSRGFAHVLGVLFKAFFLFIAGTIAFGLFVGLIGIIIGGISFWPLKNFILDGFWQNTFAWGTLILFLGVPLIAFIVWILRRIMRVRSQSNYLGWTFGGLWTLGWVSAALFAGSMANDFRASNNSRPPHEINISQPANGKLIVAVTEPEIEYSGSMPWIDIDGKGVDITRDTFRLSAVKIRVQLSKDDSFHVETKIYSRGRNVIDADGKANAVVFHTAYADSILDVGSGIAIGNGTKFRFQQAIVFIRVPAGKKIRFDETVGKLKDFGIRLGDNSRDRKWSRDWEYDSDYYFDYQTNVDYTMGADGELLDASGRSAVSRTPDDYRYSDNDTISVKDNKKEKQIQIDEEKRKRDSIDQRIKDLEKNKSASSSVKKADVAFGPSPVSSVSQWF